MRACAVRDEVRSVKSGNQKVLQLKLVLILEHAVLARATFSARS